MPKKEPEATTITTLADKADEECIPTGIAELDEILGGGVYRGRITELWGSEGTGKTHIVCQLMANVSDKHKVLFVDTEFALNKKRVEELGANPKNINYIADSHLERVCELIVEQVDKFDVIILDSLAYLTPLTVDTNEIGQTSIGLFARLIKHWVVKFRPRLGTSKTAFIAINQYRAPLGLYAKAETPGGKAWHHAVDTRIYLTSNSADKITKGGKQTGHWVHAVAKKNKLTAPGIEVKFKVEY